MKRSLIDIGGEYAVDFYKPARPGARGSSYQGGRSIPGAPTPKVLLRRRCVIVDKRSNGRLVVQYRAQVCINAHDFPVGMAGAMARGLLKFEEGWKLVEVSDSQVVARWGEQPPAQVYDGRPVDDRIDELTLDGAA